MPSPPSTLIGPDPLDVVVGLGSNLGDRHATLNQAARAVAHAGTDLRHADRVKIEIGLEHAAVAAGTFGTTVEEMHAANRRRPHRRGCLRISEHLVDRPREAGRVPAFDEQPRHAVVDDVEQAADGTGDDRDPTRRCLQGDEPEALTATGHEHDVRGPVVAGQDVVRLRSHEAHAIAQPEVEHQLLRALDLGLPVGPAGAADDQSDGAVRALAAVPTVRILPDAAVVAVGLGLAQGRKYRNGQACGCQGQNNSTHQRHPLFRAASRCWRHRTN